MIIYVKVLLYLKITNDMDGTITLSVFVVFKKIVPQLKLKTT